MPGLAAETEAAAVLSILVEAEIEVLEFRFGKRKALPFGSAHGGPFVERVGGEEAMHPGPKKERLQ